MKKLFLLTFLSTTWLCAQSNNVGINTDNPTAKLHVNGNMRVQTIDDIDYSVIENGFSSQDQYKALYWDPKTKEVFTKPLDQPYVRLDVQYIDNENAEDPATEIKLNPNDYFLFITNISLEKPLSMKNNNYVIGVKNVNGMDAMPIPGFELKEKNDHYTFKAFYRNAIGGQLYYYAPNTSDTITPTNSTIAPIWVGSVFAVSKKYMEPLYDITVNYIPYWKKNGGGKYGIELGKIIEENKGATSEITKEIDAQENTEVK